MYYGTKTDTKCKGLADEMRFSKHYANLYPRGIAISYGTFRCIENPLPR